MLELNKEYTYKQIIEILGWEEKGGNSKKAQINEIESAYEFYHPMNKKTHKEKKSYIFTKQLRELVEPSLANSVGNNSKNIVPMIKYLQAHTGDEFCNGTYYSMTDWYCDILDLLDKELCTTVYQGEDAIIAYCEKYGISNKKLLCDYVSEAKRTLKGIFLKALANMEKKDLVEYHNGYIFIYQMSARKFGWVTTDVINDLIKENETVVCDDLKEEHNLSDNLKGRQLLMQIYNRKDLTDAFNEFKILELMGDDNAIKKLNEVMEFEYDHGYTPIDLDHPLINYYGGVSIIGMEFVDGDVDTLAKEITTIIRNKTLKAMYSKGSKNASGERYYVYNEFEHGAEMSHIASLLFLHNEGIKTDLIGFEDDLVMPWEVEETDSDFINDGLVYLTREEAEELFA